MWVLKFLHQIQLKLKILFGFRADGSSEEEANYVK